MIDERNNIQTIPTARSASTESHFPTSSKFVGRRVTKKIAAPSKHPYYNLLNFYN